MQVPPGISSEHLPPIWQVEVDKLTLFCPKQWSDFLIISTLSYVEMDKGKTLTLTLKTEAIKEYLFQATLQH